MKKISVLLSALSILLISSCGSGTNSLLGGSWTFKGTTYNAITAIGSTTASTLTATTGSTSEVDDVVCRFTSFPPAAGTYIVTNYASPSAGQVYVALNLGTKLFTLSNAAATTATVTVSGSKINVTIPSVIFTNSMLQATDSGAFTAAITQNF